MSWLSKKNLPYWVWPGYLVAFVIVASSANEHAWAKYAVLVLIAPFPIVMISLLIMAYGEWLFAMVVLWQTDKAAFYNRVLIGFGKMFIGLTFAAFLWALAPPNQWAIWASIKVVVSLAIVSVISFFAYNWYRQWKERKRFRNIGKMMRAAADEIKLKKSHP